MTKIVKPILSFLFIFTLIYNYYIFMDNNNNTMAVFNESNSENFNFSNYLIDFKGTLNSKNFNEKFSILENNKFEIKKLYLSTKDNWNNIVKNKLQEYSFDNIENFISNYKKELQRNNLIDEIPNIDIYGIKINKVLIYTSKENIKKLMDKYNIGYEKK